MRLCRAAFAVITKINQSAFHEFTELVSVVEQMEPDGHELYFIELITNSSLLPAWLKVTKMRAWL